MISLIKPKFWDLKRKTLYSSILYPFSLIYNVLFFLKKNFTNKIFLKKKVVCIGNIYLGGTGKTPLTIKIFKIIKKLGNKPLIIRKYYKNHNDEYNMIISETGKLITDKSRLKAVSKANDKSDVLIFDDGLQDFSFHKDLKIVCFNDIQQIGNGLTLPAGPLRQKLNTLKENNIVIINSIKNSFDKIFVKKLTSIAPKIKIFLSYYVIENKFLKKFRKYKIYCFAGIGNSLNFLNLLKINKFKIQRFKFFPDHYAFSKKDLQEIIKISKKEKLKIITTEKDYLRIKKLNYKGIDFIPVKLIIKNEKQFVKTIKKYL